ncbi:hypothetical protein RIF29_39796 [Crotalaria pallida]|uniref:Apple domain-containing protein n=1 Tax=Crotalaria pallida TaxID=3830 RepID=A0AAN9HR20_CROPI
MSQTHHPHHLQLLLLFLLLSLTSSTPTPQKLQQGFSASPLSTTTSSFQPLLTDPTSNFSLGFLRHNQNLLSLAILHVSSSQPFWLANPTHPASWSPTTLLSFFNGTLLLSDTSTNLLYWSTPTTPGDTLLLLNTSNLIITHQNNTTPLWQSFHIPSNTLVQDQNFTSNMSLDYYHPSSKTLYSLRLGDDFMGLFASYGSRELLYWKRTPLEAKAEIKEGEGPIYARVNTDGYLGMYQASSKPVDVQMFNTFQQTTSFLIVRLEPDGNLRGYYWDGNNWVLNYEAITETCDFPSPCGSYGLCTPGGTGCSCLDNRTRFEPDGCFSYNGNNDDNLCTEGVISGESNNNYFVIRRSGVEPPNKELLGFVTTTSLAECEGLCEKNCSCWGALYSNSTGFCYVLDYPVQTMVGTGDGSKVGYFKVRKEEEGKNRVRVRVGVVIAVLVGVSVVVVGVGIWIMRWRRRKGVNGIMKEENGASPGPYKNLESASFRSIEMCNGL